MAEGAARLEESEAARRALRAKLAALAEGEGGDEGRRARTEVPDPLPRSVGASRARRPHVAAREDEWLKLQAELTRARTELATCLEGPSAAAARSQVESAACQAVGRAEREPRAHRCPPRPRRALPVLGAAPLTSRPTPPVLQVASAVDVVKRQWLVGQGGSAVLPPLVAGGAAAAARPTNVKPHGADADEPPKDEASPHAPHPPPHRRAVRPGRGRSRSLVGFIASQRETVGPSAAAPAAARPVALALPAGATTHPHASKPPLENDRFAGSKLVRVEASRTRVGAAGSFGREFMDAAAAGAAGFTT